MSAAIDPNAAPHNPNPTDTPAAGVPAAVDVQTQINQALIAERAEFAKQLEQATGHKDLQSLTEAQLKSQGKLQELADSHAASSATYKAKFEQSAISTALLSASIDAIDPGTVSALLSGKASVDDNGVVTIDGKPVADAVKQLLTDKPFLAKAQGGTGSGAPQATGGGKQVARADFGRMNPTDQMAYIKNGGSVV